MRAFPLLASLTHDARGYAIHRVRGLFFSHVLVIRQDANGDVYAVEEVTEGFHAVFYARDKSGDVVEREGAYFTPDCCAPRSFILRRCNGDTEGLYLVTLGARPSCQCYGYNRWQGCKHIDAVKDAAARRAL